MAMYAEVIIDTNAASLDRTFEYRVPEHLSHCQVGDQVTVPFGKSIRNGYIIHISDTVSWDPEKVKDILEVPEQKVSVQKDLIQLAFWLKENYGSTMVQALKTVLPVKSKRPHLEFKELVRNISLEKLEEALAQAQKKNYKARVRVLQALMEDERIPYRIAQQELKVTQAMLKPLLDQEILTIETRTTYRNPIVLEKNGVGQVGLSEQQSSIVREIQSRYEKGDYKPSLIYGVTGSGKTEVYIQLIREFIAKGKQAIVLIPEISLTYQTVMRFYRYFGDRVTVMNSKLSDSERYDQFCRAMNGEIDVMIGPRSALFTPFSNLGIIIIDEEHDTAYFNDQAPRYHTVDAAIQRVSEKQGIVVLGSATPSVKSFYKSEEGTYHRYELKNRAVEGSLLPQVEIVDLREELKAGNKSIFSVSLKEKINEMLCQGKQGMLFLNRRGYAGFVSCRSCGKVLKCPHCDVSLNAHFGKKLVCHYCGYEVPIPRTCPDCGSKYIAGFGTGTQKVESMLHKEFPGIRTLRMDRDTTAKKGAHEEILTAFAEQKADVLIGTQMIVKGHDFPNVTVMGVLAADLSLFEGDYRSSEHTFDLLTQAAGRAGRGTTPGHVVIQTYQPEHYAIQTAATQDYEAFYEEEILHRRMMHYPPCGRMLSLLFLGPEQELLQSKIAQFTEKIAQEAYAKNLVVIGPVNAGIAKIKDSFRILLHIKSETKKDLDLLRKDLEEIMHQVWKDPQIRVQIYYE